MKLVGKLAKSLPTNIANQVGKQRGKVSRQELCEYKSANFWKLVGNNFWIVSRQTFTKFVDLNFG